MRLSPCSQKRRKTYCILFYLISASLPETGPESDIPLIDSGLQPADSLHFLINDASAAVTASSSREKRSACQIHRDAAHRLSPFSDHRIKLVKTFCSAAGSCTPAFLPASMHLRSQAIFLPSVCIICRPSLSSMTSLGEKPWTMGQ